MVRIGRMLLLGMLLAGCGAGPATRPPEATLPPTTATSAPMETVTVSEDGLRIIVPGYGATCVSEPTLSIPAADAWKPLEDFIMEPHYLDGEYIWGIGMCDYVVCNKVSLENPFYIRFPLYERLGERQHTLENEAGTAIITVPAYRTVRPRGTFKLDVPYFLDEDCHQWQSYTTILDLPN